MNIDLLLSQGFERNPLQDYLTRKAGLLWAIFFVAAVVSALAWLAETKSDADVPVQFLVGAPVTCAGALLLLVASL